MKSKITVLVAPLAVGVGIRAYAGHDGAFWRSGHFDGRRFHNTVGPGGKLLGRGEGRLDALHTSQISPVSWLFLNSGARAAIAAGSSLAVKA
jgi:hypothetical protein